MRDLIAVVLVAALVATGYLIELLQEMTHANT